MVRSVTSSARARLSFRGSAPTPLPASPTEDTRRAAASPGPRTFFTALPPMNTTRPGRLSSRWLVGALMRRRSPREAVREMFSVGLGGQIRRTKSSYCTVPPPPSPKLAIKAVLSSTFTAVNPRPCKAVVNSCGSTLPDLSVSHSRNKDSRFPAELAYRERSPDSTNLSLLLWEMSGMTGGRGKWGP